MLKGTTGRLPAQGDHVAQLSEGLLAHYTDKPLIDPYDIYQHMMDYWVETMQDDCYVIASEGWRAETISCR